MKSTYALVVISPGDHAQTGSDESFAGHSAGVVILEDGVQDGIGDLVRQLVRMPFRYRFRSE